MTVTDTAGVTDEVQAELVEGPADTDEIIEAELVDETVEPAAPAPKGKRAAKKEAAAKAKPGKAVAVKKAPPAPKSDFTKAQATSLTNKLKGGLKTAAEAFIAAYNGRIWLALGHATWQEYLDSELGEYRVKLPTADRQAQVAKMTTEGKMSTRAIAAALGVDQKTVSNDRQALEGTLQVDSERGEGVIGTDGVERGTATRTSTRPAKPVEDRFSDVVEKVDKWVGDLVELTGDPEFEGAAAEIARRNRQDLARFIADLTAVLDKIQ